MRLLLGCARTVWARLAAAVLLGAGANASAIGLTAASAWLISRAAQHPPVLYLMVAIVSVRAFGIGRGVLRYGERLAGHDAAYRAMGELRARAYAGLERGGTLGNRLGDVVSRLVSDMDVAVAGIPRVVLPYAVAALAGAGSIALVGSLLPSAGLVLLAGLLVVALGVPTVQAAAARRAQRQLAPLRGELSAQVVELVHGSADLLAYGAAAPRVERALETDRRLRHTDARAAFGQGLGALLIAFATGATVWAALALGTPAVRAGTLDGVFLAVIVLTPVTVYETMSMLPVAATSWTPLRAAVARISAIADQPSAVGEPANPVARPDPPYVLRLENVTAGWRPGQEVIRDLSCEVSSGSSLALVGPSGSGKSTIAALLVRFLDPARGRITLNGVDIRTLPPSGVREVVGLVSEDAHLFDTTIEENLRIARPKSTADEMRDALAKARLLDWLDTLPLGLSTPVGERGSRLSGGQRRRLALARALLADFPILILDEPTEHLDDETAQDLVTDIRSTADQDGRGVILITHRPHGLSLVTQLIHLSP